MYTIRLYDEGDVWDVVIDDDDEGLIANQFPTKNEAEAFARRAANLFADVDDVQLVMPRSSKRRPGDGVSQEPPAGA